MSSNIGRSVKIAQLRWLTLPFHLTRDTTFYQHLNCWLGEVFYDILPTAGFEIREEQIYSSFRMVSTLKEKEVLLAEAGSGTGKTFAYLLPTLCYARLIGQPVVISCSSATLQEQLISPQGDIRTLSELLNLEIKAVLAKDPSNYVCSVRGDMAKLNLINHPQGKRLINWLNSTTSGDRTELPDIDNQPWQEVAFDNSLDCGHCRRNGYCHQAKARQRLWEPLDFVICSHDLFYRDLWTRRQRLQKETPLFKVTRGKVPYLPHYAAVVVDEAHLIEGPALNNLGLRLTPSTIERVVSVFSRLPLVSEGLSLALDNLAQRAAAWFAEIQKRGEPITEKEARVASKAIGNSQALLTALGTALNEMAMYQQYDVISYIQDLEQFSMALTNWLRDGHLAWWDWEDNAFWVLPRDFSAAMGQDLLAQKKPVIFTSATLDAQDDFQYFKTLTGVAARTAQVPTSFNLAKKMTVFLVQTSDKAEACANLLHRNGGRALVLCTSEREFAELGRRLAEKDFDFNLLWEGSGDSSWLVENFRRDESSVLIGTDFWEGVDVPGQSLTLVIVYSPPLPKPSPVILAKREEAASRGENPQRTVDYPAMGIKLRQGMGRLIRNRSDSGAVAILGGEGVKLRQYLLTLFPPGVKVKTIRL